MGYRIKEVSDMSGISIRMLRHYDKTGILRPDGIRDNGYRDYSDKNLDRLLRIMDFKELGFTIPDMLEIIEGTENDVIDALMRQEKLLVKKKERLERIIGLIRKNIRIEKGKGFVKDMDKFTAFDMNEIEEHKKKYAKETQLKYGGAKAYDQSMARTGKYSANDWKRIMREADGIYEKFTAAMEDGAESTLAIEAAKEWKAHISRYYYECTDEIFLGLADMYVQDERFTQNINKHADGLAQFMSKVMKASVK